MTELFATDNLRATLRFPFRSREASNRWLVGTALIFGGMFIPVLPLIPVYGYLVKVMRQAIAGDELALPEWNDWSRLTLDGLRGLAIGAIYLGPAVVAFVAGMVLYMAALFGGIFLSEQSPARADSPEFVIALTFGSLAILFGSMFLGWLLLVAGALPLPAALAHFAAQDRFSAAFDVRGWGRLIRADRWGYLLSWIIFMGLYSLVYLAFMLLYFSGIFCFFAGFVGAPMGFYILVVAARVFGQFYREGVLRQ